MGWGAGLAYPVNESSSLGLTALYRSVSIISGTIADLPLKTYRKYSDGSREAVGSWLDRPNGPDGMTAFEFVELVLVHLLLHGNFYGLNVYNAAGAVVALMPIHPQAVVVAPARTPDEVKRWDPYFKFFKVTVDGETREYGADEITHVTALGTDGIQGRSPIQMHREAISTGLAGDRAASRMFTNGFMIAGMVTTEPDTDVDGDEAKVIKASLNAKAAGVENAGDIAFVNRSLKFTPWTINPVDAQFIESRVHQVEEIARVFGVPPHLLGQTEKQTSWGTGVSEQNRGLARYTLKPWTTRIEQRLSRLLSRSQFCEFDYSGLLQSSPEVEIQMLALQLDKGMLTLEEVRKIRNLAPLTAAEAPDAGGTPDPEPLG
jgi:HK97 family phage portal protein